VLRSRKVEEYAWKMLHHKDEQNVEDCIAKAGDMLSKQQQVALASSIGSVSIVRRFDNPKVR